MNLNHSLLSPSSAERWLHCSASVKYKGAGATFDAIQGTRAHEAAEKILKGGFTPEYHFPNEEMRQGVTKYIQYIWPIALASDAWGSEKHIEIGPILGQGTCDFWALERDILHICDFKYGVSRIHAEKNSQLMLYAYGLYNLLWEKEIKEIRIHIIQPRCNKDGRIDSWVTCPNKLYEWIKETVLPTVQDICLGKEHYSEGPWCWFCAGKKVCPEIVAKKARKIFLMGGIEMEEGKFLTPNGVRCVYTHLGKKVPAIAGSENLEYQVTILIPVDDKGTITMLQEAHKQALEKGKVLWAGKQATPGRASFQDLVKTPEEDCQEWAKGHLLLKLKSRKDIVDTIDMGGNNMDGSLIKNGDWIRVFGIFLPYNNTEKKARGISCYLNSVLFVEKGDKLSCAGDEDPTDIFFPDGLPT